MLIILAIILLISFILLAEITDGYFVESLEKLAKHLHLSADVAGASLLAIGSSAPELFVALLSVLRPESAADIGAGTIVGSALFNILVITGVSVMYRSSKIHWQPLLRDLLFYGNSILVLFLILKDGQVDLVEAGILLVPYILYIFILSQWKKIKFKTIPGDPMRSLSGLFVNAGRSAQILGKFWGYILAPFRGLVAVFYKPRIIREHYMMTFTASIIYIGLISFVLVEVAIKLSEGLHVPQAIIGLVVIAVGTSVPDMFGSIAVAKRGNVDMAISNAVGSNVFDILIGLGLPWAIALMLRPGQIAVSTANISSSIILLLATILVMFFIFIMQRWHLKRWSGFILIVLYIIYFFSVIF